MIIYGTNSKHQASERVSGQCVSCGSENTVTLHAYQKYVHLFWIPFLPAGKIFTSHCESCNQTLAGKESEAKYSVAYRDLRNKLSLPAWTFSGAVLIILLITYLVYSDQQKDIRVAEQVKLPIVGDVYEYKVGPEEFTLVKVINVLPDSVHLTTANYSVNLKSGLPDLEAKSDTIYSEGYYSVSRTTLKQMVDKGEILDVIRK